MHKLQSGRLERNEGGGVSIVVMQALCELLHWFFFCLRELDCAGFRLSHIHCEVPPTLNKNGCAKRVLRQVWASSQVFVAQASCIHCIRESCMATEIFFSRLVEQISGRCPRYKSISRAHEAVSLLALYDFVWVVRVLESCHVLLVNKPLSQSLQPTCLSPSAQSCGRPSSLLPAWRTRRRFQQAVRMKKWHCRSL